MNTNDNTDNNYAATSDNAQTEKRARWLKTQRELTEVSLQELADNLALALIAQNQVKVDVIKDQLKQIQQGASKIKNGERAGIDNLVREITDFCDGLPFSEPLTVETIKDNDKKIEQLVKSAKFVRGSVITLSTRSPDVVRTLGQLIKSLENLLKPAFPDIPLTIEGLGERQRRYQLLRDKLAPYLTEDSERAELQTLRLEESALQTLKIDFPYVKKVNGNYVLDFTLNSRNVLPLLNEAGETFAEFKTKWQVPSAVSSKDAKTIIEDQTTLIETLTASVKEQEAKLKELKEKQKSYGTNEEALLKDMVERETTRAKETLFLHALRHSRKQPFPQPLSDDEIRDIAKKELINRRSHLPTIIKEQQTKIDELQKLKETSETELTTQQAQIAKEQEELSEYQAELGILTDDDRLNTLAEEIAQSRIRDRDERTRITTEFAEKLAAIQAAGEMSNDKQNDIKRQIHARYTDFRVKELEQSASMSELARENLRKQKQQLLDIVSAEIYNIEGQRERGFYGRGSLREARKELKSEQEKFNKVKDFLNYQAFVQSTLSKIRALKELSPSDDKRSEFEQEILADIRSAHERLQNRRHEKYPDHYLSTTSPVRHSAKSVRGLWEIIGHLQDLQYFLGQLPSIPEEESRALEKDINEAKKIFVGALRFAERLAARDLQQKTAYDDASYRLELDAIHVLLAQVQPEAKTRTVKVFKKTAWYAWYQTDIANPATDTNRAWALKSRTKWQNTLLKLESFLANKEEPTAGNWKTLNKLFGDITHSTEPVTARTLFFPSHHYSWQAQLRTFDTRLSEINARKKDLLEKFSLMQRTPEYERLHETYMLLRTKELELQQQRIELAQRLLNEQILYKKIIADYITETERYIAQFKTEGWSGKRKAKDLERMQGALTRFQEKLTKEAEDKFSDLEKDLEKARQEHHSTRTNRYAATGEVTPSAAIESALSDNKFFRHEQAHGLNCLWFSFLHSLTPENEQRLKTDHGLDLSEEAWDQFLRDRSQHAIKTLCDFLTKETITATELRQVLAQRRDKNDPLFTPEVLFNLSKLEKWMRSNEREEFNSSNQNNLKRFLSTLDPGAELEDLIHWIRFPKHLEALEKVLGVSNLAETLHEPAAINVSDEPYLVELLNRRRGKDASMILLDSSRTSYTDYQGQSHLGHFSTMKWEETNDQSDKACKVVDSLRGEAKVLPSSHLQGKNVTVFLFNSPNDPLVPYLTVDKEPKNVPVKRMANVLTDVLGIPVDPIALLPKTASSSSNSPAAGSIESLPNATSQSSHGEMMADSLRDLKTQHPQLADVNITREVESFVINSSADGYNKNEMDRLTQALDPSPDRLNILTNLPRSPYTAIVTRSNNGEWLVHGESGPQEIKHLFSEWIKDQSTLPDKSRLYFDAVQLVTMSGLEHITKRNRIATLLTGSLGIPVHPLLLPQTINDPNLREQQAINASLRHLKATHPNFEHIEISDTIESFAIDNRSGIYDGNELAKLIRTLNASPNVNLLTNLPTHPFSVAVTRNDDGEWEAHTEKGPKGIKDFFSEQIAGQSKKRDNRSYFDNVQLVRIGGFMPTIEQKYATAKVPLPRPGFKTTKELLADDKQSPSKGISTEVDAILRSHFKDESVNPTGKYTTKSIGLFHSDPGKLLAIDTNNQIAYIDTTSTGSSKKTGVVQITPVRKLLDAQVAQLPEATGKPTTVLQRSDGSSIHIGGDVPKLRTTNMRLVEKSKLDKLSKSIADRKHVSSSEKKEDTTSKKKKVPEPPPTDTSHDKEDKKAPLFSLSTNWSDLKLDEFGSLFGTRTESSALPEPLGPTSNPALPASIKQWKRPSSSIAASSSVDDVHQSTLPPWVSIAPELFVSKYLNRTDQLLSSKQFRGADVPPTKVPYDEPARIKAIPFLITSNNTVLFCQKEEPRLQEISIARLELEGKSKDHITEMVRTQRPMHFVVNPLTAERATFWLSTRNAREFEEKHQEATPSISTQWRPMGDLAVGEETAIRVRCKGRSVVPGEAPLDQATEIKGVPFLITTTGDVLYHQDQDMIDKGSPEIIRVPITRLTAFTDRGSVNDILSRIERKMPVRFSIPAADERLLKTKRSTDSARSRHSTNDDVSSGKKTSLGGSRR